MILMPVLAVAMIRLASASIRGATFGVKAKMRIFLNIFRLSSALRYPFVEVVPAMVNLKNLTQKTIPIYLQTGRCT